MKVSRAHPLWLAYVLHRLSGLALALFIPVHLWVLSRAVTRLDSFLAWTDRPLVKLAETGLVFLLAVHAFGGLRLLALEQLGWTGRQKTAAAGALAAAVCMAGLFGIRAI